MDKWLKSSKKTENISESKQGRPSAGTSTPSNQDQPSTSTSNISGSFSVCSTASSNTNTTNSEVESTSNVEASVEGKSGTGQKLEISQEPQEANESPSSRESNTIIGKRKKKVTLKCKQKRSMKFSETWMKNPEFAKWLCRSKGLGPEMAYCKTCGVEIVPHKSNLISHSKSARHAHNSKKVDSNKKITDVLMSSHDKYVTRAELKLCGFLAQNNLSFSTIDTLEPLCKNIFLNSKIAKGMNIKRTKSTKMVEFLGNSFVSELSKKLKNPCSFFSVIMDETTDISVKKECAFTVIYYDDEQQKVNTRFLGMSESISGKAIDLHKCLTNILSVKNIPLDNFVGFSSDTTNVMAGEYQSVFALLKKDNPHIVLTKCSCHSIHLATSKACLELPRSTEDLIRSIGAHFSRSASRQEKFKEFQDFFKTESHKVLQPSNTRWLSVKQCTDRVLEQYEPLKAYFRELLFEDPSHMTEQILTTLNNQYTLVYLEFLSYVLELTNDFNLLFQSEKPLLHKLKSETERLLKHLCSNFMDLIYIRGNDVFKIDHKNPNHFVNIQKIYLGVKATNTLNVLDKNDHNYELLLKSCLKFYLELVSQIKKRFDFSDPLYQILGLLTPQSNPELISLAPVVERFPVLEKFINIQALDNEWKDLALLEHNFRNIEDTEEYWKEVFDLKNAAGIQLFPNLSVVVKLLLVLPYSNASVERVFSSLKNIKTEHRNRLGTNTINSVIFTKEGVIEKGGIVTFELTPELFSSIWKKT